jgi:hypothetical protein
MRRQLIVLSVVLTTSLPFLPAAEATGAGGWNHVGVGSTATATSLNGSVAALHTSGSVLYVGGTFTNAGGRSAADRIATWDGYAWGSLGTTPIASGAVSAIAHYGSKIFAGGTFLDAGGDPDADYLAVFDGTSWAPFCDAPGHAGAALSLQVAALQVVGDTLFVGGFFQNGAGYAEADYLLACDLATGAPRALVDNDGDLSGPIYALAADANGLLYAGGRFNNLDGILAADNLASYDGAWDAVPGVDSFVRALTARGTTLYVGADSLNIGGLPKADHVASWNGTAWSAIGGDSSNTNGWFPTTSYIYSMTTYGSSLFATGSFQDANGKAAADNIAYWDGTYWRALGSNGSGNGPWVGEGHAVHAHRGLLYAGGNFTSAGGDTLARGVTSHSLKLADARIGVAGGGRVGDNVFNSTGAGQTITTTIPRGSYKDFSPLIQNEGPMPASFRVKAVGACTSGGYSVAYYDNAGTQIGSALNAGTYDTATIPVNGYVLLKIRLGVGASSSGKCTITLTVSSYGTPNEVVKAVGVAG